MAVRSILITGCSSGIGRDAALTLQERGWQVFASCRTQADCDAIQDLGLHSPRLDYTDPTSVTQALKETLDVTGGTLNALFNNGAYALPGAVEDLPTNGLRALFEANFFGWHELTRQVIPVMRAQGHGRIVQCSSVLGFTPMKWRGAYVSTKFALEGLTDTLRMEMADTGIHISIIEPGPIRTAFRSNAAKAFERWIDWEGSARADQYRDTLLERLNAARDSRDPFELPPSAVTKRLIHAIESPRPKPRYFVTAPTWGAAAMVRILPTRALDWVLRKG